MGSHFIDIQISSRFLDLYIPRRAIWRAFSSSMCHLKGKVLDIGCGSMPYKGSLLASNRIDAYVGLEIVNSLPYGGAIPDALWDGIRMPFENESFDSAFSTEVLEHVPDPKIMLLEVFRVLKPGGSYFFTVPFLWPLHEVPNDAYRYTPFSIERIMTAAGFEVVTIQALGGWNASLGQLLALWIRRSIRNAVVKKLISVVLLPLIWLLAQLDSTPDEFREGQMITGLYGIVCKPVD